MKTIDKLAWIQIKDRKLLATKSKGKRVWYMPGGKREQDESDKTALARELKEELTIDLIPESTKYLNTFTTQAHGKDEGVLLKVTCYTGDYNGNLNPASEIEAISWINSQTNPKTLDEMDQLILNYMKGQGLID